VQVKDRRVPKSWIVGRDDAPGSLDERRLVERARLDPNAFSMLYRAYVTRVHGFAYRRTGSYEAAEEITASTFERAWRGLATFAWQGGGFEPWLFRIASNEVVSHYRSRTRLDNGRMQRVLREMAQDLRDDPALVAVLEADEKETRIVALRAALETLPARYQEVINLRYLAGVSADGAAAAMGCSKATLAVTLHRALRALRRAVDSVEDPA
jgi:RNA polymerase sigma-70 factor (ECF subfamily)